jgi:hypothetical protein
MADFDKSGGAARPQDEVMPPRPAVPQGAPVTPVPKTPYSHLKDRLGHD